MSTKTGLIVAAVVGFGLLIWYVMRGPSKVSVTAQGGQNPGSSNALLNFGTSLVGLAGKLIPPNSSGATGPKPGTPAYSNPSLVIQDSYPGDNESGTGITDGGT